MHGYDASNLWSEVSEVHPLNTHPRPPKTAWPLPVPITVLVVLRLPTLRLFKIDVKFDVKSVLTLSGK
jgi:hypothetical protein